MSWTWQKVLGFGITAFLVATLIFAAGTGLVPKTNDAQQKANSRVDTVVGGYAP
ncbi:hypothetical protein [Paenibacillus sp. GP183]|uniref:hypothetical protein n=1 Tax=Paenibacillus sp. GP183 TaxID=1882751 RepID=UPI000894C9C2|nr:hypothetical protein [Paenibacillus sp. GP183]SED12791.1 hypothetical protein SAMN05443246_5828 [Paenibacillus sp. GP183]